MIPRTRFRTVVAFVGAVILTATLLSCTDATPREQASPPKPSAGLPVVTPNPQEIHRIGTDVRIPERVRVLRGTHVDTSTLDVVRSALRTAGAQRVEVAGLDAAAPEEGTWTVLVGSVADSAVVGALPESAPSATKPPPAEGYAVTVRGDRAVLAGADSDGAYYAAQTFRQLAGDGHVAGAGVRDFPTMPVRGSIEGFYGSPWTHRERMDQLAFYGKTKMNTYVYTPKDDPYLRQRWREPYPAAALGPLEELIGQAQTHHVDLTYGVSPGLSVCFSDPRGSAALVDKLDSVYRLGVRSFSVPFDDVEYQKWNCAADQRRYGQPSKPAAARAQADLLNAVHRDFIRTHPGVRPLQSVPTEYSDVTDSPYKAQLRAHLDPAVRLMWTGVGVIPRGISATEAHAARTAWGREVLVWDNYPVNDWQETTGRLLLAPYDRRERGLHEQVSGVLLNPMNQAAASKVALFGGADFSWNDTGYDPARAWRAAAEDLSGHDPATTEALLCFFDTEHYAPTSDAGPAWARQAPALSRRLDEFTTAWDNGDRAGASRRLRDYARLLAGASAQIRAGVTDLAFVADSRPWLDALALWGAAFMATIDGIESTRDGDHAGAGQRFADSRRLAEQASQIRTVPGETKHEGPVLVADGVLDRFLEMAPGRFTG